MSTSSFLAGLQNLSCGSYAQGHVAIYTCVCVVCILHLVMQSRNQACFVLIKLMLSLCCFSLEQINTVCIFLKKKLEISFFLIGLGEGGLQSFSSDSNVVEAANFPL